MTLTIRGDMKTIFGALSALLLTTAMTFVAQAEADTTVQFGIGYRTDDINTKFRLDERVRLNSFSKLHFKDLEIFTIQAKAKSACGDCSYFRAEAQYGWILDGDVRESDQFAVPSTTPFSRNTQICVFRPILHNDVKGRYVWDLNFAIGYPLQQCWCEGLQLVPTLGFAYDTQRIRFKNHDTISNAVANTLGFDCDESSSGCSSSSTTSSSSSSSRSSSCFKGGHNNFRTTWWGPFIGLDFAYNHCDCWNLYGELELHWMRVRNERNTHLCFKHVDHHRRSRSGWGYDIRIGSIYYFRCNWFFDGHISYKRYHSHQHQDTNTWSSWTFGLDLGYAF